MRTLADIHTELRRLDKAIDGLLTHEHLSAAQLAEHDDLVGRRHRLIGEADIARRREERRVGSGRLTDPEQPGGGTTATARLPATVRRTADDADHDPTRGFRSPREFLLAVMRASAGPTDERLRPLFIGSSPTLDRFLTAGNDEARGNSDPSGGFLVPEAFSPRVLTISPESDPTSGYCQMLPMGSSRLRIPARVDKDHRTSVAGGITVTRRPETIAALTSQLVMQQVVLEAYTLLGASFATEELLMDSPAAFVQLLEMSFSQAMSAQIIKEKLTGTGVGEYLGVLVSPCLVTVTKETGQAAGTLVYENVIKARSQCWGYGQAIWLANHDTMPQLMLLNQSVGTGGVPVWQPSAREDAPDMLLGRPLVFSEYVPSLGSVGDLLCGNWSQYLEGIYQPLLTAESVHVRFLNHERAFKAWTRNAGAPWWTSSLTPAVSSKPLSPFVAIQAR